MIVNVFGYKVDAKLTGETKTDSKGDLLYQVEFTHTVGNMAKNYTWQYEQDLKDLALL